MKHECRDTTRRHFLKLGALLAAVAAGSRTGVAFAQELPHLSESDPTAQALGYRSDATKVDRKKYPKYQPGEHCANCQFFQGKAGQPWGPCNVFPGKAVHANGWCSAYVKKA